MNPKPKQLTIEEREIAPSTALVALGGRLMLGPEGMELEALVGDLLNEGYRRIVFDMGGLTHIDSTGIGRCISSFNKITQAGGNLHLAAAAGQVRESFRVTHLDRIFRFYESVEAAVAGFK